MQSKIIVPTLLLAIGLASLPTLAVAQDAPGAGSQEAVAIGGFANYFRFSDTDHRNFAGIGGRMSFRAGSHVQMEGELAYDFEQFFTESFTDPQTNVVAFQRSPVRFLHGLFGPKFHTGGESGRAFLVVKTGFINARFDDRPATFGTFVSSVEDFRGSSTRFALYPGGGVEQFWGPLGIRLELGDEIYFLDGAHHNLRITFGPGLRF